MKFVRRMVGAVLLGAGSLALTAMPASAHTGFESSVPADGTVVESPLDTITLVFTGQAEPTGDEFQLLDAAGTLRFPAIATTQDGLTWTLQFDPPVAAGDTRIRWAVKAPDAHPITGSFSFSVDAPAVSDEPTQTTLVPATTNLFEAGTVRASAPTDLDEFLATNTSDATAAKRTAAAGRFLSLLGALVGVGALIFAAVVLRGDDGEVRYVIYWVRRAGLIAFVGAMIELTAQLAIEDGGSWSGIVSPSSVAAVATSSFGIAIALRATGGLVLCTGAKTDIYRTAQVSDPAVAGELVGVGSTWSAPQPESEWSDQPQQDAIEYGDDQHIEDAPRSWLPSMDSRLVLLGAAALLISFLFDGHTVSKGNRLTTAAVDLIHVAGAAVWAGGVIMLAAVLWRRHRQGRELLVLDLAARFSVVAAAALAIVGIAGLILAFIILDTPLELLSTHWGRLLIAKTFIVVVAVSAGAYNHLVLIPELTQSPDDSSLNSHFLRVVSGEALALGAVMVITAFLMGAAS